MTQNKSIEVINQRCDKLIRETLPEGYTYCYLGNLYQNSDDRSWRIYRPTAGRDITPDDVVGPICSTENRRELLPIAEAIASGYYYGKQDAGENPLAYGDNINGEESDEVTITIERRDLHNLKQALFDLQEYFAEHLETADTPSFIDDLVRDFQSVARLNKIMRGAS